MPNDAALESITGAKGVFAHAKPGMIYVDTSTVSGNQMIKDLDHILWQGAPTHTPLLLTALMRQHYDAIAAQGEGELDYIATVRLMERMAGSQLESPPYNACGTDLFYGVSLLTRRIAEPCTAHSRRLSC